MKDIVKEYLMFLFYTIISIAVVGMFFYVITPTNETEESLATSIINEDHIRQSMADEAVNQGHDDETNMYGYYEKIDSVNVYFNINGRALPYGYDYDWQGTIWEDSDEKFIKFKDYVDPDNYRNADGTENRDNEHCLALIKYYNVVTGQMRTEEIDLTSFVTPANYTNEHPIPIFDYLHTTPKEYEATIELVPYVLNWENIHIKLNVPYFIYPKTALLTFTGNAKRPDTGEPFSNKRITFFKGDKQMAVAQTDPLGNFLIGVNTPEGAGLNTEDLMPIGEYKLVIDAEGEAYSVSYPEDRFDIDEGDSTTISLGEVTFVKEGA